MLLNQYTQPIVALGSQPPAMGAQLVQTTGPAGPGSRGRSQCGECMCWVPQHPRATAAGPARGGLTLHPWGEGKGMRQGWGQAEGRGPMTRLSYTKALLGSLCQATSLWASFPSVKWAEGSGGNPGPLCLKH